MNNQWKNQTNINNLNMTQQDNLLKKKNSNRVLNPNDNVIPLNGVNNNSINNRN